VRGSKPVDEFRSGAFAASFCGVRLHVDSDGSPCLRLGDIVGELYVAADEHDEYVPSTWSTLIEQAMQQAGVSGRFGSP